MAVSNPQPLPKMNPTNLLLTAFEQTTGANLNVLLLGLVNSEQGTALQQLTAQYLEQVRAIVTPVA